MKIASEGGGSIALEYETFRFRKGESFVVLIDSVEVLRVTAGAELDSAGFSV